MQSKDAGPHLFYIEKIIPSLLYVLQIILATLTPIGHELKAEERYLFDLIAAALVSPHILHHKQHTIKQTVLSCLREVVRISALEPTSDAELLSPSSSRSRNKVPCPSSLPSASSSNPAFLVESLLVKDLGSVISFPHVFALL
jgi:hypothetical protein